LDLFNREKELSEVKMLNPLVWAYVGDSVYELYVRVHLTNTSNAKPHKLHMESIKYIKAKAQADILDKIENNLTDDELDIVRRGRNTENHHVAKNADPADYTKATSFEALLGYLYLTKQDERLDEILGMCID
jgi:ribonuclease-3 family protein